MPASMGTMSRSDSAFTMSSMTLGGRSESFTITLGAQMKAMHNLRSVEFYSKSGDGKISLPFFLLMLQ